MNAILWQRVEGALVFAACLAGVIVPVFMASGPHWWLIPILFFAPDLGFLGYLAGPRVGAFVYNTLHLYGWGLAGSVFGLAVWGSMTMTLYGLIWMAHVGFDRMLGYGLKERTGFGETHLGRIGRG